MYLNDILNMAPTQPEQTDVTKPRAKEISDAIACVFCFNTVDANLVQGLIANEISRASSTTGAVHGSCQAVITSSG
ncbi:hypothetical protein CAL7716_057580 [Calothrix sp. PCC 7716]|nr:hypothetical protein CAL7716_057580 [Calothrix sp. PCC 7716]